jgi:hypothetical protein
LKRKERREYFRSQLKGEKVIMKKKGDGSTVKVIRKKKRETVIK